MVLPKRESTPHATRGASRRPRGDAGSSLQTPRAERPWELGPRRLVLPYWGRDGPIHVHLG